jgi:ferredoxin-NADP reductase
MRLGVPRLPALLVAHHRPGFYLRVITEGHVQAGDQIIRTQVGRHALSVADIDALLYLPKRDIEKLRVAVDIPALSPGWQRSFRELLDAAANAPSVDEPPLGVEPGWAGFRQLRVAELVPETTSVTSIYLTADNGHALPRPKAGQYLTLRAAGAGGPAPLRSYSLSSSPNADTYRISVKREPHGIVSAYLHSLHRGSIVNVAAPRGDFILTDDTNPVLLISAGIGVTPVLAMLHQLAAAHSTRDVWWIHTAHDAKQHAFAAEAHQLLQSLPRAHERIFYTSATAAPSPTTPVIRGRPTLAALASLDLPADAVAYICGPTEFMNDMQAALQQFRIAPDRIRTELFGARPATRPGVVDVRNTSPHQPPGPAGAGPQISFARTGLTVHWSTHHRSLLGLADACDVPTRWSCRTGVCNTCITSLVSGKVSYSPTPLDPPAQDQVLICCARPETDIVLDM